MKQEIVSSEIIPEKTTEIKLVIIGDNVDSKKIKEFLLSGKDLTQDDIINIFTGMSRGYIIECKTTV